MARPALFLVLTLLLAALAPLEPAAQQGGGSASARATLDYEVFKTKRAADPDEPAQGQRALHGLSRNGRRQFLPGAAAAGEARHTPKIRRGATSSACRGWSCRANRSRASCSSTRWPRRRAAATGTAAASTGSRRTIRNGRRSPRGCERGPGAPPAAPAARAATAPRPTVPASRRWTTKCSRRACSRS